MAKKAQFGIVDLASLITFVIVIIIFLVIMNLPGCSGKSVQKIKSTDAQAMQAEGKTELATYLRSPVEVGGKTITIAEAISIRAKSEVKNKLNELTEKRKLGNYGHFLNIVYPESPEYEPDIAARIESRAGTYAEFLSVAFIPSRGELIEVELYGERNLLGGSTS